ncbi:hypothetical protein BN7_5733 [Wickerhamomyces ciferrii]|uniref:Protein STU1 n=1 Tax=Wickerhamomyces ciferrii (strain ATCC 14091 / BCRC 22168 / CBS 111 / JCM 3599 / NBRC 0793 / NRRL Y-1031 F-60-10) TaxID=1206466 RepID=K0KLK5_WICCF|nr:uncharacterized protein BN7_5733 [Wickerhamomyces ciferrii]CCH46145.1 hypothetical protein BN7_5733 [Wickerhamomyces ciferrii]
MSRCTGDELYNVVSRESSSIDEKTKLIAEFKAHIKRDFVDLNDLSKYFGALKIASKSGDARLASVAFSTICHLVKRVSMQDSQKLKDTSKITLPILFNKLLDQTSSHRSQAKNCLETFWLASPDVVEHYLKDSALIHSNQHIRSESIIFISDLIDLNNNFSFSQFLPSLVNLLRDDSAEVFKNTEVLFIKYFILNRSKLNSLVKEFKTQSIDKRTAIKILKEIDITVANSYSLEQQNNSRPTIDSFNNLTKSRSSKLNENQRKIKTKSFNSSGELSSILGKINTTKLDENIQAKVFNSLQELHRETEALLSPFAGKETEFNWGSREKNILKFRSIVIGNADSFPDDLVQATRLFTEGISKSITSLRTTLSSNGCQLVKELAAYLNRNIDHIAESLFMPLASLTSATKRIASMNAYGALCVLLTNTSFNNRLFNQCFNLFQDKSVQPRLYSATFLQIFILKHGTKLDEQNFETLKKWLGKGVSDPNITVRESMRLTFWTLHRRFPAISEHIFTKLDSSIKKALERSKPSDVTFSLSSNPSRVPSITGDRKRHSVREFVASKQRERRSTSDTSSLASKFKDSSENHQENLVQTGELGRASRLGGPQRIRVSSAGSSHGANSNLLPRQLSKGSKSMAGHSNSDEQSLGVSTTSTKPEDDAQLEHLKTALKSPLTRERVEGIQLLEELLKSNKKVEGLSPILINLIILDSSLLKPLLKEANFYDLLDIDNILKLLAVNKENLSILQKKFEGVQITNGLCSVINSLMSMNFDSAPAKMFHIKYKRTILDFSVLNLYNIMSQDAFKEIDEVMNNVCRSIIPLSIDDYPRFDELINLLFEHNSLSFGSILEDFAAYERSKIHSIIDDFKVNKEDNREATEYAFGEMTMINPLNRKPNDPTTSIRPGFGTDMTMILPGFKSKNPQKDNREFNGLEHGQRKVDYMGDIFHRYNSNNSTRESTVEPDAKEEFHDEDVEMVHNEEQTEVTTDKAINIQSVDGQNNEEELNHEEDEDGDIDIKSEAHIGSPFLDDPHQDDALKLNSFAQQNIMSDENLQPDIYSDEITKNITSQIKGIHISPQKQANVPIDQSASELFAITDPIFKKTPAKIKIFEDKAPQTHQDVKLTELELSRFDFRKEKHSNGDDEKSLSDSIVNSIEKFENDNVSTQDMDRLIQDLHLSLNEANVLSWFEQDGYKRLVVAIISYFNTSKNITKSLCFKGLVIIKEILALNSMFKALKVKDALSIWNILVMIVENLKDFRNEIYIASDELVDELIDQSITNIRSSVRNSCHKLLKQETIENIPLASFLLTTVVKCMEHETLSLEQINEIGDVVHKYLTNEEVEIRRLSIIVYSKCKNKLQIINPNLNQQNVNGKLKAENEQNSKINTNEMFDKLSASQKKLIDYYSNI